MKQRVLGQDVKHPYYAGMGLCPRAAFYEWATADPAYARLFESWKRAGFPLALSPSIDRIDKARGYTLGNMQFITLSENSRKH